jgi:ribosomal protein L11 methyltransferase
VRRQTRRRSSTWTGKIRSLDVGERLRLVPIWERGLQKTDRLEIVIDPGPAFGVGEHPTTVMALEFLEREMMAFQGKGLSPSMLDVGTGTGVLAIAGLALGTGFTVGLDIDASAVFTAKRNFQINAPLLSLDSNSVGFFIGGVQSAGKEFEIVAANLAAPTLLRIKEEIIACTGSLLVLSGIAEEMAEEVVSAYSSNNLELICRELREGWVSACFHKAGA